MNKSKSKQNHLSFYNDVEPYNPPENRPLYWDDCTRYIVTRTIQKDKILTKKQIIHQLSLEVWKRWNAADLCPLGAQAIENKIESVILPVYKKYSKGSAGVSHQKREKTIPVATIRKSSRLSVSDVPFLGEELNEEESTSPPETTPQQMIASDTNEDEEVEKVDKKELYQKWMRDYGERLFDVFITETMKKQLKNGYAFDSDFLDDQRDPNQRRTVMHIQKVTKNFIQNEKERQQLQAKRYVCEQKKKGNSLFKLIDIDSVFGTDEIDDEIESNDDHDQDFKVPLNSSMISSTSNALTRSILEQRETSFLASYESTGTQTDKYTPQVFTRDTMKGKLCAPEYLEAGAMLMALNRQSASQAVMSMLICDKVIHKQKRKLPLVMQKKYRKERLALKRMIARKRISTTNEENEDLESDDDEGEAQVEESIHDVIMNETERTVDDAVR